MNIQPFRADDLIYVRLRRAELMAATRNLSGPLQLGIFWALVEQIWDRGGWLSGTEEEFAQLLRLRNKVERAALAVVLSECFEDREGFMVCPFFARMLKEANQRAKSDQRVVEPVRAIQLAGRQHSSKQQEAEIRVEDLVAAEADGAQQQAETEGNAEMDTKHFQKVWIYRDEGKPAAIVANDGDVRLRFIVVNADAGVVGVKMDKAPGRCPLMISLDQRDQWADAVRETFEEKGYRFNITKPGEVHTLDKDQRDEDILAAHFAGTRFWELADKLLTANRRPETPARVTPAKNEHEERLQRLSAMVARKNGAIRGQ